jgi:hypothetical protein
MSRRYETFFFAELGQEVTWLQAYQHRCNRLLADAVDELDEREREAFLHYMHMRTSIVLGPQVTGKK